MLSEFDCFGLKSRWGVTQLALWSQVPSRFVLIRYKDLVTQLRRNYERDNGFLQLSRPESYPYKVSVRAPNFDYMINHLSEVRAWQEEYEKSDLAPFLVYEKRRGKNGFGQHRMLAKVCFASRYDFEHWIAPDKCPIKHRHDYILIEKAHQVADYVRNKPQVQTLAEKLRTNRAAMTESELYAVRTEPLFINMHTVPVEGADSSVRGTVILAGIDRLLHGHEGEYLTADIVNERYIECRKAQVTAFRYALTEAEGIDCLDRVRPATALVGGQVKIMPAVAVVPKDALYCYDIKPDKLMAAARRAYAQGNTVVPPPEFAMFGLATAKVHYVVNHHKVSPTLFAPPAGAALREQDQWDVYSASNLKAGVRADDPDYGTAVDPDMFMTDEEWTAYNLGTDRFAFEAVPGSFEALDEIRSRIKKSFYPELAPDSPEFARRSAGLEAFMLEHPRKAAEMARDFLLAVQLVDYMAALKRPLELYCRQLALPHMDSKFIERNYAVLDELFSLCLGELYPVPEEVFELPNLPDSVLPLPPQSELVSLVPKPGQHFDLLAQLEPVVSQVEPVVSQVEPVVSQVEPQVLKVGGPGESGSSGSGRLRALKIDPELQAAIRMPKRGFRGFLQRWTFKDKPDMVRLRLLDPSLLSGFFMPGYDRPIELSLELSALKELDGPFKHVIICENEVSCLALPRISNTIALFGSGYAALILAFVPFMHTRDIIYWGDIDTHGFDILNRLRQSMFEVRRELTLQRYGSYHPDFSCKNLNVRSMFMDQLTLLSYQDNWVTEEKTVVQPMPALRRAELECYEDLISNKHGRNLRLEQEYIPFAQVLAKLHELLPDETIIAPEHFQ